MALFTIVKVVGNQAAERPGRSSNQEAIPRAVVASHAHLTDAFNGENFKTR